MKILSKDTSKLEAYENNPRHNDDAVAGVAASIKEFGFLQPIVINSENVVVAGHTRLKAAKQLDLKRVPCISVVDLTPEQIKAYRLLDNKLAEKSSWDPGLLQIELQYLTFDFEPFEVEWDIDLPDPEVDTTEDEVPEAPEKPISKLGDLWLCGRHRVLCGDCYDLDIRSEHFGDFSAIATITDPPYCVGYENQQRTPQQPTRKQRGDSYKDPEDSKSFLNSLFETLPSDVLVMSFPLNKHFHNLADASRGWDLLYDCIWLKHHFAFIIGRNYQPKHEPIFIFRRKKGSSVFNVPANQSTVFEHAKPAANKDHPTIKPLNLYIDLVNYHSNKNDIIYEPFCGSGTTLIACERTSRICYSIEMQPRYVDVICQRFYNETGIVPKKKGGKKFPVAT